MGRKSDQGFTIIELIIVIAILAILTTLVVARLSSTQVAGRDQERENDIRTIATALETYYRSGDPLTNVPPGHYPGGNQVATAAAKTPPFSEFLEGVPLISYAAPGHEATDSFNVDPAAVTGSNPDGSYSDSQARNLLSDTPYLYQPLQRNNTLCDSYTDCVKFNLYYLHESSDAVVKVRSKNQ